MSCFFKMGVSPSTPIKNRDFNEGTYKRTTLNANCLASSTVAVTATSPAIDQILRSPDLIQIGPSTYAGSEGATETATVSSVTAPSTITINSALTYNYSSGDPVSFVGSRLGGSWGLSSSDSANIAPAKITVFPSEATSIVTYGYADNWAQGLQFKVTGHSISQQLGDVLSPSAVYRAGVFVQTVTFAATGNAGDIVSLRVHDGVTAKVNLSMFAGVDNTTWVEKSAVSSAISSTPTACTFSIHYTKAANNCIVLFDLPYLEHAINTDDAANGVYTFDDEPDYNSIVCTPRMDRYSVNTLANGDEVRFDPTGRGNGSIKYDITAEFTDAKNETYNNLMLLKRWQDMGNLLVFHVGGDYTVNTSPFVQRSGEIVPPVMYGWMEITPKSERLWDLINYTSFSFKFHQV